MISKQNQLVVELALGAERNICSRFSDVFRCLFIVLKISSSHGPVMTMFHYLFIVLKISLFSMPSSDENVPLLCVSFIEEAYTVSSTR